jgi:Tfp pilus assembly PilM family ATPase
MSSSLFFKLFPPPAFLAMPHAGLDISDDAIKCIEYHRTAHGLIISRYATKELPPGLIDGGDIKDEKELITILKAFAAENALGYVKVSLPEEKAYLFQTEVPTTNFSSIAQNIEFKLDQNVPLSAADAFFQFDLMPKAVSGESLRASVSVVPRTYVEHYIALLRQAHLEPVAFEVAPKSIVAACTPTHEAGTRLIVHVMKKKTGLYIVSEGVVCFTSTIGWGSDELKAAEESAGQNTLTTEINRVYSYWLTRPDIHAGISEIVVVGSRAEACELMLRGHGGEALSHSVLPDVWHNAFDVNAYVPPITRAESLEYAIAAGLAL